MVLVVLTAQCQHPSPRRAPWYFTAGLFYVWVNGSGRVGSSSTESCAFNCSAPTSHGWPFLKQWISESWEPSTARLNAQDLNDFVISSVGSHAQVVNTHSTMVFLGGGLMFPASVNSWTPLAIHSSYCSDTNALKGLFQLTSVRYPFCVFCYLEFEGHVVVSPFLTFVWYSRIVRTGHCNQRNHTYWSSRNFYLIYFYYIITKTFQRSVLSDFTFGGLTPRVLSAFVIDTPYSQMADTREKTGA